MPRGSPVGSLEPPYERLGIAERRAVLAEKHGKRFGQHSHMVPPGARKPAGVGEDEPHVPPSFGRDTPMEHREVLHVLGHNRSALRRRGPEQILVGQPDEIGTLLTGRTSSDSTI